MKGVIKMPIQNKPAALGKYIFYFLLPGLLLLQGCVGVNAFPTVARAGDTVSVMIGGTEKARKNAVSVILTDIKGQDWDLQSLGLVRSVFNLRADGRAVGNHYTSYAESFVSWSEGHEPLQTVLVVDIPVGVAAGDAVLSVDVPVGDDSSGITSPYSINIEILPGQGANDNFVRQDAFSGYQPADFGMLEPAPHAKITFGANDGVIIGAVSLVVDFDEAVVSPDDLNVYAPTSNVRGSYASTGSFGDKQRMVYWRQDGSQLYLDIIAPQGINQRYLMAYIVHPPGIASPLFNIVDSKIFDTAGNEILLTPVLEYYQ